MIFIIFLIEGRIIILMIDSKNDLNDDSRKGNGRVGIEELVPAPT